MYTYIVVYCDTIVKKGVARKLIIDAAHLVDAIMNEQNIGRVRCKFGGGSRNKCDAGKCARRP